MAIETTINFDNPINFSYDSDAIEFVNGKAKLKDLRPVGAILHHSFDNALENWSGSSFNIVTTNSTITGGCLNMTEGQISYATSANGGLSGFGNKGSIVAIVKFGVSGNPTRTMRIFRALNLNDTAGLIELFIDTSGIWRISLKDSFGKNVASSVAVGSFPLVANIETEIAWVFDTVLGYHRLFVGGVASATTLSYTYTRNGSSADVFQMGHNLNVAPHNLAVCSLTIFNTILATGDYSAGLPISPTAYKDGYSQITNTSTFLTDSILSFDFIANASDVSTVVNVGSSKKYFDGVAWVTSSSPEMSNTLEQMQEAISSLDISNGANISFTVYLKSDGKTTADITQIHATYDFDFVAKTPNLCTIYGAVIGANDLPVAGATVSLVGNDFLSGETIVVNKASTRSDASGRFELSVFETETSNTPVTITIEYKVNKEERRFIFANKIIPNLDSVPISDL